MRAYRAADHDAVCALYRAGFFELVPQVQRKMRAMIVRIVGVALTLWMVVAVAAFAVRMHASPAAWTQIEAIVHGDKVLLSIAVASAVVAGAGVGAVLLMPWIVGRKMRAQIAGVVDESLATDMADIAAHYQHTPKHCFLVATIDGDDSNIVGCAAFKPLDRSHSKRPGSGNADAAAPADDGTECEAARVAVSSAYRRRGIASTLMSALEGAAKKAGYKAITATTGNDVAASLYRKLGYAEESVFHLSRFVRIPTLRKVLA